MKKEEMFKDWVKNADGFFLINDAMLDFLQWKEKEIGIVLEVKPAPACFKRNGYPHLIRKAPEVAASEAL